MPFIRLSDNYIDHPKFLALSASAFRLWHEGMAFCRKHQTDGLIPSGTLQGFRYFKPVRVTELSTPYQDGANPLWETVAGFGYKVHDYLFWNLSKDEEQEDREGATARMRKLRATRKAEGQAPSSVRGSPVRDASPRGERSPNVQDRIGCVSSDRSERESEGKPIDPGRDPFTDPDITERAGRFLERYPVLYQQHLSARYAVRPGRDYQAAVELCATWPDDRLDKLAVIYLKTDHEWARNGSRTVPQFRALSSWCDTQLAAYEAKHGAVK